MKIKTIEIENFRGVPHSTLKLDGKNLLIYGENGTGKSSIIEAVEYFFTNKISSLQGFLGCSIKKNACHANSSIEDLQIKVTVNPGSKTFEKKYNELVKPSQEFSKVFEIARNGTFILRRNQLIFFISCTPKEKFKALASIIKLDHLENVEQEFEDAAKRLQFEYTSRDSDKKNHFKKISRLLGRRITNIENAFNVLNSEIRKIGKDSKQIENLQHIEIEISNLKSYDRKSFEIVNKKGELQKFLDNIKLFSKISEEINKIKNLINQIQQDKFFTSYNYRNMLNASYSILQEEEEDICPLCEQYFDRLNLIEKTAQRLDGMQELHKLVNNLKRNLRKINSLVYDFKSKIDGIIESIKYSDDFIAESDLLDHISLEMESLLEEDLFDNLDETLDIFSSFEKTSSNISDLRSKFQKKINEIDEKTLELPEEDRYFELVKILMNFKNDLIDILEIQKFQEKKKKQVDIAIAIWNSFKESKLQVLQNTFDKIEYDIERYYRILHGNDPHENIKLELYSTKKDSAQIKIDSFGRGSEDPRGYLSEGHIDSLGICIFLAFIKNFNKSLKLIVLDDIVTTIDSQHREQICKLLFEEFKDYQMIITTHDKIWYEQIKSFQRTYKFEGNFQNLTIQYWDLTSGPVIHPYESSWERIESFLKAGLTSSAASEGRRYLEWLLLEICKKTEAKVIFRQNFQYTVSDLLEPAKSRIEKLILDDQKKKEYNQIFDNISTTLIYANYLSHNNPFAKNLSVTEVRNYCDSVKKLHESWLCDSCSNFLIYRKQIKKIICNNNKCKNSTNYNTK